MSRTISFSYHLGEAATPVEVEFRPVWEGPRYYGDYGSWEICDLEVKDSDGKDLTDTMTKDEEREVNEKAVRRAEDNCDCGTDN